MTTRPAPPALDGGPHAPDAHVSPDTPGARDPHGASDAPAARDTRGAPDAHRPLDWPDEPERPDDVDRRPPSRAERRTAWWDRAVATVGLAALGLCIGALALTAGDLAPRDVARELAATGVRAQVQRVTVRPAEEPGGRLAVTFEAGGETVVANAVGSGTERADEDPATMVVLHDPDDPTRAMLEEDVRHLADEALPDGLATAALLAAVAAGAAGLRVVRAARARRRGGHLRAVDPAAVAAVLVVAATVSGVVVAGEHVPAAWSWLGFPVSLAVTVVAVQLGVRVALNDRGAPRPTRP
ncbi:hypothetical protein [Cellulomonas cellasea]|uniref:Uncharacterized protein n=2 Tax=Cellulomonas cellasea TaxID=43670 RepID=A0A0A0B105_9CELL|nr:hypothetical protein [Cellulomonas cellasea]KGM00460.1 hypothetical protein Q760_08745 [Cellulomonas cellasea DSM 20118]GEA86832.1 hypothetical protein CCE01nite_07810 [Cellulomonas cellasea]